MNTNNDDYGEECEQENNPATKDEKYSFRVVKDSPATSKISKAEIEKALEKAIALTAKNYII